MHAKLLNTSTHCARGGSCRYRYSLRTGRLLPGPAADVDARRTKDIGVTAWKVATSGGYRYRRGSEIRLPERRFGKPKYRDKRAPTGIARWVSCILPTASIKLWEVQDKPTLSRSYFRASPGTSRSLPTHTGVLA